MKFIYSLLSLCLFSGSLYAQTVVAERSADLVEADYDITGTATIREYDDGSITLSLSDDFDTPAGPDVRIFLNDELNSSSAIQVADLSELNHFSGALTVDVPMGTDLDANSNVVFYCFAFNQLWAYGELGEPIDPNPMTGDTCQQSLTATFAWVTNVETCGNDGVADEILLLNNIEVAPGDSYAFLLTDTNEVLLEVVLDSIYDFEGKGTGKIRIYGISYLGELNPQVGQNRMMTTASECYIHSGGNLYLTVDLGATCTSNVNEVLNNATNIYPNPVNDLLTIELPNNHFGESISIRDLTGRVVLLQSIGKQQKLQVEVADLAKGQYILNIATDAGLIVKRFVAN